MIATHDSPETPSGTITVALHGLPHEPADRACNDPKGSTACSATLPLLCSKADTSRPATSPLARQLALTSSVRGTELVSVGVANQICRAQLGEGWKMTEVHEASLLHQITGVDSLAATSRFWVRNAEGLANARGVHLQDAIPGSRPCGRSQGYAARSVVYGACIRPRPSCQISIFAHEKQPLRSGCKG